MVVEAETVETITTAGELAANPYASELIIVIFPDADRIGDPTGKLWNEPWKEQLVTEE